MIGLPLAAGALLAAAGGSTLAAWRDGGAFGGETVRAGDLSVTTGQVTYQQVTPGVAEPSSGPLTTTPDFTTMPGDVIDIRVPVTTFLQGDNLVAALTASYAAPASLGHEIAATFHVEDADGNQVMPAGGDAATGTSLAVPGLVGSDAGVTTRWTVVLHVRVLGDYQWVTPHQPLERTDWSAGTVSVDLDQVRTGPGYDRGGA